jgi:hypothetical protein
MGRAMAVSRSRPWALLGGGDLCSRYSMTLAPMMIRVYEYATFAQNNGPYPKWSTVSCEIVLTVVFV